MFCWLPLFMPLKNLLGRGLVVLHRARPLAPDGRVDLVAVVAEVLQPALVLVGQHLLRQRRQVADIVGRDAERSGRRGVP